MTMQASDWIQFALYFVVLALITKPMGLYLLQVLDTNGRTWLDPVLRPLERLTYRLMGVDSSKEHNWKQYTLAMLLFSLVGCLFTYGILRLQNILPLNPEGFGPVSSDLAFNTAANPRCRISRRWSRWPFIISVPPRPALPSPPLSSARLRATRRARSATSGWIWCA